MSNERNWDLTPFFPDYTAPERTIFRDKVEVDLESLVTRARKAAPLSAETFTEWEKIWVDSEGVYSRLHHYYCYVSCLNSCDSGNEVYQKEMAAVALLIAVADKIETEALRSLKEVTDADFESFVSREQLFPIKYNLTRFRERAKKTMTPELENLATDMSLNGISAWGRLYNTLSGKLEFEMKFPDGKKEMVPMAKRRSLTEDVDRRVREAAFRGGNEAWAKFEDVTAAALNNIAGSRLMLNKRRGIDHFLDVALFQARITKKTLDAMFEAVAQAGPFIQEIAATKAKAIGREKMAYFDIDAPLPLKDFRRYPWEECLNIIERSFRRGFPELADYFKTAIEKRWIESEVKSGKRPGAFCTGSPYIDQSRVFMTYNGSLGDVQTLAHEIGHAFHSNTMAGARLFSRSYPMTLAESASTFGEMLLTDGLLDDPETPLETKGNVLNIILSHAMAFLLDIPVRFEFEKNFHEEREKGEVSVSRLKELMVLAQKKLFGDILEEGGEDPYFWASKLHFYITSVTFYNYPYTFGFLLSRGLNACFRKEGTPFLEKYKEFLKYSGSDTAENVVKKTLGYDLEKPDFWYDAIVSLKPVLEQFKTVLDE